MFKIKNRRKEREELKLAYTKRNDEYQKSIVEELSKLNKLLENGSLGRLSIDNTGFTITNRLDNLASSMITQTKMEDYIQKEILYNKDYDRCDNENPDLLKMIETYFKFDDKYEVIDIFDKVKCQYEVKSKSNINKNKEVK